MVEDPVVIAAPVVPAVSAVIAVPVVPEASVALVVGIITAIDPLPRLMGAGEWAIAPTGAAAAAAAACFRSSASLR